MRSVSLAVNGVRHELDLEPRELLVYVLRERLGLTGTNVGCDTSSCGACTVLLNGESVKSCTLLGVQADGREVTTIEGSPTNGDAAPAPAGLPRAPRAPVRLLHARDGAWRRSASSTRTRTRARTRSGTASRATSAAAPATRTSSRPCGRGGGGRSEMATTESAAYVGVAGRAARRTPSSSPARLATSTTSAVPGMVWMAVVRSPYAHARITSVDLERGARGRGRRRRVLRRRPRRRVGGSLPWPGRSPRTSRSAALAARERQGALRRRRRRRRRRRDARAREGRGRARRGRLRAAARRHRRRGRRSSDGAPIVHDDFGTNDCYTWTLEARRGRRGSSPRRRRRSRSATASSG